MGTFGSPLLSRFPKILLLLLLAPALSDADVVLTGALGANSRDHFRGSHFGYSVGLYSKFDGQTLIGIQSGQGTVTGPESVPILGHALVRLPLGGVVMPVASGGLGYALDADHPGFLWQAGGGLDMRNGRRSSLLALGAYERQGSRSGWVGRLGILLEF